MKTILKFGGYSCLAIVLLFAISYFFLSSLSLGVQEIYGYLSILVSLAFVFFGVKAYRNLECNGKISFFKALGVGLLVTLFPSVLFGAYNVIYVEYIDPDMAANYYQVMIDQAKLDYSGSELAEKIAEMKRMKEMFSSPFMNFLLMASTVFFVGVVVSVISAVALRKNEIKKKASSG